MKLSLEDVKKAQQTIEGTAIKTPLVPSPYMSKFCGLEFLLKLEMTQPIGAFKLRGATNAIFNLPHDVKGVACCSTGNHGRGVAYAAKAKGIKAIICMSSLVPQTKVDGIKALGAEVRIIGNNQDEAQVEVDRLCKEEGLVDINPFDDPFVIAGQGTIGLELLEQRPDLSTILVPLSGGGLAGGIALAVKALKPEIKLVGISMDRGACMVQSMIAGKPVDVDEEPSLADSLGGGIGLNNQYSFNLCNDLIDETVLVSEKEIYRAMQVLYYEDRMIAEGGSVVGLAAVLAGKLSKIEGPVASIISGRNVDMKTVSKIMQGEDVVLGDRVITGSEYHA